MAERTECFPNGSCSLVITKLRQYAQFRAFLPGGTDSGTAGPACDSRIFEQNRINRPGKRYINALPKISPLLHFLQRLARVS
jgi:hypothetical protein